MQQLLFCCNLFRLTIINHLGIILCGLRFLKGDTTLIFFFAHLEFPPIPTVISTITCASTPTSITSSQIYNLLLYFIDIFLSHHSPFRVQRGAYLDSLTSSPLTGTIVSRLWVPCTNIRAGESPRGRIYCT